ncbi:pigment biosynthesis protein ayg1 [Colletotrichum incanum]|uniref:Pigment biosynthesis protein ayg1 n=1 Tax=Colletotrichum incanum TaxID=1573173 RepID=A0A161VRC8_COLIC|nr:pigment biosynthesis protein ayg1 [Colletotrichum incanum]
MAKKLELKADETLQQEDTRSVPAPYISEPHTLYVLRGFSILRRTHALTTWSSDRRGCGRKPCIWRPDARDTRIKKWPAVLLLISLDSYRPDFTIIYNELPSDERAVIPGTADCSADSADPESPDRLWSSMSQWMERDSRFDMSHLLCLGLRTGGYYAIRIAHKQKDRLLGSIAEDGRPRVPVSTLAGIAMKNEFGSVQRYKEGVQRKFSLLELGVIQKPSTILLLLNGTLDGLMPVEDSLTLFAYGSPKEARFSPNALHMGNLPISIVFP